MAGLLLLISMGLAMIVIAYGLLVVVDQPPTEKNPRGSAMLTLTTYGLSDAALADLQARWQGWWDQCFETAEPGC